jgi:hypothetical protein
MSGRAASFVSILGVGFAGLAFLTTSSLNAGKLRTVPRDPAEWQRTTDGWRRAGATMRIPRFDNGLHPVVLASGQLTLSLLALMAFPGRGVASGSPAGKRRHDRV